MPVDSTAADRDYGLPLGSEVRPGSGPRSSRSLGARGDWTPLSGTPARRDETAAGRIFLRAAVRPGSLPIATTGPAVRERRDPHPSRGAGRAAAAAPTMPRRCERSPGPIAALNSVEPAIFPLLMIDVFNSDEAWTEEARPKFEERLEGRLKCLSDALGDKDWLEDRFTIGDLMMVTVLRQLAPHRTCSTKFPNLAAWSHAARRDPHSSRRSPTSSPFSHANQPQPEGEAA